MLGELCSELKNWFTTDTDKQFGDITIENGIITPPFDLQEGQYFRIVGSVFNDGVYQYSSEGISGLTDEVFNGALWIMKVPREVLKLAQDIEEWNNKYQNVVVSPYQSESFGGYSYSKSSNVGVSWQSAFKTRMKRWRKL